MPLFQVNVPTLTALFSQKGDVLYLLKVLTVEVATLLNRVSPIHVVCIFNRNSYTVVKAVVYM